MLNKENAKMRIKYFGKSIFSFFMVGVGVAKLDKTRHDMKLVSYELRFNEFISYSG